MIVRFLVIFCILGLTFLFSTTTVAESLFGKRYGDFEHCDKDDCSNDKANKNTKLPQQQQKDDHPDAAQNTKSINPVAEATPTEINVILTFVNAQNNRNLQDQFKKTTYSILQHASVPLQFHIIAENASQILAYKIIEENNKDFQRPFKVFI